MVLLLPPSISLDDVISCLLKERSCGPILISQRSCPPFQPVYMSPRFHKLKAPFADIGLVMEWSGSSLLYFVKKKKKKGQCFSWIIILWKS